MAAIFNRYGTQDVQTTTNNLPVKRGFWGKFKEVLFKEIKIELSPGLKEFEDNLNEYLHQDFKVTLTPGQQEFEDNLNAFLHQEVTWQKVHDFLFQEIHLF